MSTDEHLMASFASLFEGNLKAYGQDTPKGVRCVRLPPKSYWLAWDLLWDQHLKGGGGIGVYPMVSMEDAWYVKWGCVDLDIKAPGKTRYDYETEQDAHTAAQNLVRALDILGIQGWIERTRGSGRHVWVFAKEWVSAAQMRRALLVACSLSGASAAEVNPKSETLGEGQLGNFVRLPYPGGLSQAHRGLLSVSPAQVTYDDNGVPLSLEDFLARCISDRVYLFEAAAALYREPERTQLGPRDRGLLWSPVHMPKRIRCFIETGPQFGDRSSWLYLLGAICAEEHLTQAAACAIVSDADELVTQKYTGRSDAERRYAALVGRAYGEH
jgi:hypothetical protein